MQLTYSYYATTLRVHRAHHAKISPLSNPFQPICTELHPFLSFVVVDWNMILDDS